MYAERDLLARVERLERANRRLTLLAVMAMLALALGLVGWQEAGQGADVPQVVKVHELQVVDQRGVPMITLNAGRDNQGGAMTLRDSNGERRAWWTASPDGSNLALVKEKAANAEGANTAGFSVAADSAEMNLIGADNAMLTASVHPDQPRIDLWNAKGKALFGAPWKAKP